MTTSHSIESTSRKIVWGALALFAVTTAACGGATQSITGTAPSSLSATSATLDAGGTFSLLKEGRGKGPDGKIGETPTAPTEPGDDQDDHDSGHDRGALQFEGFTSDIGGTCPNLTIVLNEQPITTDGDTEFQRGDCEDLQPATTTHTTGTTPTLATKAEPIPPTTEPEHPTGFHLHIAAKMDTVSGKLVATYVRMQGPKVGHGDDDENENTTTP